MNCFLCWYALGFINGCSALNELISEEAKYRLLAKSVLSKAADASKLKSEFPRQYASMEFIERACQNATPVPDSDNIRAALGALTILSEQAVAVFVEERSGQAALSAAGGNQVHIFSRIL